MDGRHPTPPQMLSPDGATEQGVPGPLSRDVTDWVGRQLGAA
jgi:hypothetical protein